MLRFTHVEVFSLVHGPFVFIVVPFRAFFNIKGGISFFYLHFKPGTRSSFKRGKFSKAMTPSSFNDRKKFLTEIQTVSFGLLDREH